MFSDQDGLIIRREEHGEENETKNRPSEATDAAAAQPPARRKIFRSPREFRSAERTVFRGKTARLQSGVGPETETAPERIFYFRHHPGRRPRHPDQSASRSAFRAAMVPPLHSLSRNAARGCARRS